MSSKKRPPPSSFGAPFTGVWGDAVLASTDWRAWPSAYDDGQPTHALLLANLKSFTPSQALCKHLQSAVVHQSTLFPVCEPTTRFLLPRTIDDSEWATALREFWDEWREGLSLFEEQQAPSAASLARASQTITSAYERGEEERLFEDRADDAAMTIALQHTYHQANRMRPLVCVHYGWPL